MNLLILVCLLTQIQPEPTMYIDGISVSDVDVGEGEMKTTLSVTEGRISLSSITGLTFIVGTGTFENNVVFTGKIGDVNAALNHIKYYVISSVPKDDILNIEVDDQGNTGSGGPQKTNGSVTIIVPKGPIIKAPIALNATEDIVRNITGISIEKSNPEQIIIKVILSSQNGTLRLFNTNGLIFIEGDGNNDKSMTFYGNLEDVNISLSTVYYKSDLNFNGTDYVNITASDFNQSSGSDIHTDKSIKMNLAAANDKPTLVFPQKVEKS